MTWGEATKKNVGLGVDPDNEELRGRTGGLRELLRPARAGDRASPGQSRDPNIPQDKMTRSGLGGFEAVRGSAWPADRR